MTINIFLLNFFGVKMRDKMAISAYILKIAGKDLFLRLQMRAKEDFNRHELEKNVNKHYKIAENHKTDSCTTNYVKSPQFNISSFYKTSKVSDLSRKYVLVKQRERETRDYVLYSLLSANVWFTYTPSSEYEPRNPLIFLVCLKVCFY